jgi:hypothetical protein
MSSEMRRKHHKEAETCGLNPVFGCTSGARKRSSYKDIVHILQGKKVTCPSSEEY